MKNNVKFSIRKKLFLFILVTFSILIILILWQIRQQALNVSTNSIQTSLEQSTTILDTKLDSRFYSIREVASSISKDGRVLPLVFDRESLTLQDLSLEFKDALEFDSLFFIADDGEILARSDRPEAVGRSVRGRSSLFDQALDKGLTTQSYIVSKGKILQIVVEPIFDNVAKDVVRGLVAVAYELSPEIAADINKLTASDVSFFTFTRNEEREINGATSVYITETSLQNSMDEYINENRDVWNSYLSETNQFHSILIGKETYFTVSKTLMSFDGNPLGFILTFRSRSELMEPFNAIEESVIMIGLSYLLVSIVIGVFISVRLTKPILKLVEMTNDIQEGKYPTEKIKKDRPNDELDLLFNTVVQMGDSIREKNELESYLAGIANELESSHPTDTNTLFFEDHSEVEPVPNQVDIDDDATAVVVRMDSSSDSKTPLSNAKPKEDVLLTEIGDRYKLLRNIGEGQFGIVFLALDTQLNEKIALKTIEKRRLEESELTLDLHEEIKLARRITHRNITRTYDFGNDGNILYITMEFIDGFTLDKLIKQNGPINTHLGLILVKQMCSAIHAAHEQGIIHRDLKPQNISITQQGVLKIMDFGLAVSIKTLSAEQREKLQQVAAGTPKYMAPEQFFGSELDTRTDIYALGILMYYIFSGEPPYQSNDFKELAKLHSQGAIPSLSAKITGIPSSLSDIVEKAMQKEPENRFQSVKEIYDQLNSISFAD